MIFDSVVVDIGNATPLEIEKVKAMFLKNYADLMDDTFKNGRYVTVNGYWTKEFRPMSKDIITPAKFFKEHGI